MPKYSCRLAGAAMLASLTLAAHAHAADNTRFYVGGTLGVAVITPDNLDVNSHRRSHGNLSGGVFAGARLGALPIRNGWPVFAEIGYQDIASHKVSYYVGNSTTELTARGHSAYLGGKVNAPLTERLSLYGKLGVARNSVTGSTPAGQTPIPIDGSKTGLLAGFGIQYDYDFGLSLRGEITSYGSSSDHSDAAAINFGVAYRF